MEPDVYRWIPWSMTAANTLNCYVLYDGHPKDKRKSKLDITVCLQGGKVVELSQRECVSSIVLSNITNFKEIQIMRNNIGDLFYIVATDQHVILLSSKDQLLVQQRFPNVLHYEVCDPQCSGEAKLMIKTLSSTQYISFNDVKEINGNQEFNGNLEDTKPAINALKAKLIDAEYNLVCNQKAYKEIEKLRQHASFLCHGDGALQISKPLIRFCNKKIVIQLEVQNPNDESINKVCVFLHNTSCNSICYTTKVYEHLSTIPFYKDIESREIKGKCKASVVVVVPISEFKKSISSRIDFSVIVSYERNMKNYLQSFDNINISAADVMGENFDVFGRPQVDAHCICIAMLSTTIKTSLCLKQHGLSDMISLANIFRNYLKMDLLGENIMMAIHQNHPHHILHGIMIVFDDNEENINATRNEIDYNIDVYTRSPSQVLALIHLLYDVVPLKLIVTTSSIQVTHHDDKFLSTPDRGDTSMNYDYTQCVTSLSKQSSMTLEYLDNCLIKMNKCNNDKTNIQINLFAMGSEEFVKYRNNMLEEAKNAFESLVLSSAQAQASTIRTSDIEVVENNTDWGDMDIDMIID